MIINGKHIIGIWSYSSGVTYTAGDWIVYDSKFYTVLSEYPATTPVPDKNYVQDYLDKYRYTAGRDGILLKSDLDLILKNYFGGLSPDGTLERIRLKNITSADIEQILDNLSDYITSGTWQLVFGREIVIFRVTRLQNICIKELIHSDLRYYVLVRHDLESGTQTPVPLIDAGIVNSELTRLYELFQKSLSIQRSLETAFKFSYLDPVNNNTYIYAPDTLIKVIITIQSSTSSEVEQFCTEFYLPEDLTGNLEQVLTGEIRLVLTKVGSYFTLSTSDNTPITINKVYQSTSII